jgi:hypothetical protein
MHSDAQEDAIHNIVARLRVPGPDYYEVLHWVHEELRPTTYLEIGVFSGHSLKLAKPPTIALGIDPSPKTQHQWEAATRIVSLTSREFFQRHQLREFLGSDSFSFAFIDGSHLFEQVIEDFLQLESLAAPDSLIALHDTIPLDELTASRERGGVFYTGDVWKTIPFLKEHRPDLEIITVRAYPSGLTFVRKLDPSRRSQAAVSESVERFRELPWDYYSRHRQEFLSTIPNQREAVVEWLRGGVEETAATRLPTAQP